MKSSIIVASRRGFSIWGEWPQSPHTTRQPVPFHPVNSTRAGSRWPQMTMQGTSGGLLAAENDAVVEVMVRMRKGNRTVTAIGVREDIVKASIEAVLSAMNVLTTDYNHKNHN